MTSSEASFTTVFSAGLQGHPLRVVGLGDDPAVVPTDRWSQPADDHDLIMVDLCVGPTLDIGCGPGRMTEALAARGQIVLGIDVVGEAVEQTLRRGAPAIRRDVFGTVPAEGRWETALLADGNVGIGGDPVALMRRASELLSGDGRVVVEVAEPGIETRTVWAVLEGAQQRSRPFRWAVVGADAIAALAVSAGLEVRDLRPLGSPGPGDRWCAVLGRAA